MVGTGGRAVAEQANQAGPVTITSTELLAGLRDSGNDAIWQTYVDRYRPLIVDYARRFGAQPADADDIAQQALAAFAAAYRRGAYDRRRGRLRDWLFGIVRRQLRNWYRRRGREVQAAGGPDGTDFFAQIEDDGRLRLQWDERWRSSVLEQCLNQARAEVHATTWDAFELFALRGWPATRVAEHLGITENAVFGAKRRLLSRIRRLRPDVDEQW